MAQTLVDFSNQPALRTGKLLTTMSWAAFLTPRCTWTSRTRLFSKVASLEITEASARYIDLENTCKEKILVLKLKGDGKTTNFASKPIRLRFLRKEFNTTQWQEVRIALKDMYPSFRGRRLNRSNFEGDYFGQLSLLIGNKKAERFSLEIESIQLQ